MIYWHKCENRNPRTPGFYAARVETGLQSSPIIYCHSLAYWDGEKWTALNHEGELYPQEWCTLNIGKDWNGID